MKIRAKALRWTLFVVLLSALAGHAQLGNVDRSSPRKAALTIVGTYHMGAAGNNVYNGKVDDISSPERQKEIGQLVANLKRFKPTKVVLECDWDKDAKTNEAYTQYLAGTYQLSKNETNQIGFRLAKESGHERVYCVDWSDFWDDPAINYMKYAAKDPELDAFVKKFYADVKTRIDAQDEKLRKLTVTQQLAFLNHPEQVKKDAEGYYDILRIGRGNEYAGAGYVAWWHRRNLVILQNIIRLTDSPNDRILVIYGSGHLKLLNQFARESGFYDVQDPLKYLTGKN